MLFYMVQKTTRANCLCSPHEGGCLSFGKGGPTLVYSPYLCLAVCQHSHASPDDAPGVKLICSSDFATLELNDRFQLSKPSERGSCCFECKA